MKSTARGNEPDVDDDDETAQHAGSEILPSLICVEGLSDEIIFTIEKGNSQNEEANNKEEIPFCSPGGIVIQTELICEEHP